jgi:adenylosuccinate synthase
MEMFARTADGLLFIAASLKQLQSSLKIRSSQRLAQKSDTKIQQREQVLEAAIETADRLRRESRKKKAQSITTTKRGITLAAHATVIRTLINQ